MPSDAAAVSQQQIPIWSVRVAAIEGSDRRFWGEVSSPSVDRENEIVEPAALRDALDEFLTLPIIDFHHTGIPIGIVTKAWWKGDRLRIEGRLKPTEDCDLIWKGLTDGILSELSIWGKRLSGSPECRLDPSKRTRSRPCVTKAIRLYTISLCPTGTAMNRDAWAEALDPDLPIEDLVKKAMTSTGSALIHPTVDGTVAGQMKTKTRKRRDMKSDKDAENLPPGGDEDRTVPGAGTTDVPPVDRPEIDPPDEDVSGEDEIEKAPTTPDDDDEIVVDEGGVDEDVVADEPTLGDVMALLSEILGRLPPAVIDKVQKAREDRVLSLEEEIQTLRKENEQLKKSIRPPKEIVIDKDLIARDSPAASARNARIERLFG